MRVRDGKNSHPGWTKFGSESQNSSPGRGKKRTENEVHKSFWPSSFLGMELRGGDVEGLGGGEGVAEPGVQGQQVHVMDGDIVAAGRGLPVPGVDQRCPVKPAVAVII